MGDAVQILVNGKAVDCVSTSDRGLLYGDGVFETIAVESGRLRYWPQHLHRLQSGCERLGMENVDETLLVQECRLLIEKTQQAVIKVIITRGSGGRGYRLPEQPGSTRVIQLHKRPDYPASCKERGIRTRICRTRLGHNLSLAGIKHLNRLEQVLARMEWDDPAIMEGLMLDTGGNLVEGTMSNVFMVKDGVLVTPDLRLCGVAGIIRARVLAMAAEHSIETRVERIGQEMLLQADEVFVCNSLIGIWPVIGIDKHIFQKGPVTMRLQMLLTHDDK
jgi:4-amino-4-deoxychorismate lyase